MRLMPGGPDAYKQVLREHAERDVAVLVPRPGQPIYGLSAPALTPARVSGYSTSNDGEWASVTLTYGDPDQPGGPAVAVTTAAGDHTLSRSSSTPLPDARSEQELADVAVTVEVWGVDLADVQLAPVPDLRPIIEARVEETIQRIERKRREPKKPRPPLPDLPPAEGVAALRALADFTMTTSRELRASFETGERQERGPDSGRMHQALWQRAVRERQRAGGVDADTADEDVTTAVNHLGRLQGKMTWFTDDPRLRAAAIDETLRYAMLGENVPSIAAQQAWTAYWSARMLADSPWAADPDSLIAWQAGWTAWAAGE